MKKGAMTALLIGMWAMTQVNVIGFLGISELVMYLIAPFILVQKWDMFKKDGMSILYMLLFLTMISCFVSGIYNQNDKIAIIKGFATIYGLFACITVIYPILREDPDNLKWILVGIAISGVICVFIFQPGSAHIGSLTDRKSLQESVMSYSLFWPQQINTWSTLPIKIAYLKIPLWYAFIVPFVSAFYSLISTTSGRSAFLVGMFGLLLLFIAKKNKISMIYTNKKFVGLVISMLIGGILFANVYKYAAKQGLLGEKSQIKYRQQVLAKGRGEGILAIIMGGRIEFFIGATACLKHPILGCGPHAEDKEGLIDYFYNKYGTHEDLEMLERRQKMDELLGINYRTIPAHSHIITFWLWYGMFGGLTWVYILIIILKTLKNYFVAIPQWIGYFALIIPSATMSVMFSPFGDRVMKAVLICACIVARNVAEQRISLSQSMVQEIQKMKDDFTYK